MKTTLMSIVLLFMLLSPLSFSQQIDENHAKFKAVRVLMVETETEIEKEIETDIKILVFDDGMVFDTGIFWKFVGEPIRVDELNAFYIDADFNGEIRCRVWFYTENGKTFLITVQFSDYTFYYECYLVK